MSIFTRLHSRAFQAYLVAFALMALPPIIMYLIAKENTIGWFWPLLGLVILGNLLLMFIK
jgi:hypothetical protein